jgi:DNA-binding MarR family transcriptional regulator
MPPKLTLSDYRALAEFRYQVRRFLRFGEDAARRSGLEPRQHQLLLALKGLPPDVEPTIGELARRLRVEHHTAVEMIDRLERRRLVARRRDDRDRRRVLVRLSGRGNALLLALSVSHREELRTAGPQLVDALKALMSGRRAAPGRRRNVGVSASNGRQP